MCVPEVGRQDRQAPLGVFAVSIPAQQSLEGKSVAKIVQARASTAPRSTQSNLSRQYVEHPVDLAFVQSVAILIHEKVRLCSRAKASVPPFGVIGQDLAGGAMQWNQPRFTELGAPNGQHSLRPVHVVRPPDVQFDVGRGRGVSRHRDRAPAGGRLAPRRGDRETRLGPRRHEDAARFAGREGAADPETGQAAELEDELDELAELDEAELLKKAREMMKDKLRQEVKGHDFSTFFQKRQVHAGDSLIVTMKPKEKTYLFEHERAAQAQKLLIKHLCAKR